MTNHAKPPNLPKLQECNLNFVKSAFSEPRMSKYLNAFPKDDQQVKNAMRLYQINMLYCESLYPSLHSLEIALRNSIDLSLSEHYGRYWLIPNKSFFQKKDIHNFLQRKTKDLILPDVIDNILLDREKETVFHSIKKLIESENRQKKK